VLLPAVPVEPPRPAVPVLPAVPVVPAVPVLPAEPLVPAVPVVDVQTLFTHCWPLEQTVLQLPQCWLSPATFTQAPLHSICPETAQAHAPLMQVDPPEQTVPQPPQLALSVAVSAQAPPGHIVAPPLHMVEQALLLQTWPLGQALVQLPQWVLSEAMQLLLQLSRPALQTQEPAWQLMPLPQDLPQVPQFCVVVTSVQTPLQLIWPAPQLTPVPPVPLGGVLDVGVAQPATTRKQPTNKELRKDKRERGRVFIALPRR
jgi:hypothetical protein